MFRSCKRKFLSANEHPVLWSTVSAIFWRKILWIKRASVHKFPYRNLKCRLDLQNQTTISPLIATTITLNIQKDNFVYRSDLETTVLASTPSKNLKYAVIISFLQKMSLLTMTILTTSTGNDIVLQNKCEIFESIYDGWCVHP